MTVTIGRRELLVALGGVAAACARSKRSRRSSSSWARARRRASVNGLPLSRSGSSSAAGPKAAISRSSIAGRK